MLGRPAFYREGGGVRAERLPRAVHVRGDVFGRMLVSGRRDLVPVTAELAALSDQALSLVPSSG